MDCKEKILSENVYDYITDYPLEGLGLGTTAPGEVSLQGNLCYVDVDDRFHIVYADRRGEAGAADGLLDYQNVPKLYGLMQQEPGGGGRPGSAAFDPGSLIASGITQVQRPPLSLTGRGVVIAIVDTGIDYRQPAFLD